MANTSTVKKDLEHTTEQELEAALANLTDLELEDYVANATGLTGVDYERLLRLRDKRRVTSF